MIALKLFNTLVAGLVCF